MALGRFQRTIQDAAGNIMPGATITVRKEVPGAPLAQLYSDRDGLVAIGNPITADADGMAAFHAIGGPYRIDAVLGASTATWRYVPVGTAAEGDLADMVDAAAAAALNLYAYTVPAAAGDGTTDDAADIQAVLDTVGALGVPAEVWLTKNHGIGTKLTIPVGVTLRCLGSAKLTAVADVTVVQPKSRTRFYGRIDTGGVASYVGPALLLDGADMHSMNPDPTVVDAVIYGVSGTPTGTAIKLTADTHLERIAFAQIKATVFGYSKGVHILCTDPGSGNFNFINGNVFDLTMYNCVDFVKIDRGGSAGSGVHEANGNKFNVEIQAQASGYNRAVLCEGKYNEFNMMVWDWSGTAIEFHTSLSQNNRLNIRAGIAPSQISGYGTVAAQMLNRLGPIIEGAWLPFTPTIASSAGTLTSAATSNAYYKIIDKIFYWRLAYVTTTIGTGSGTMQIGGFPVAALRATTAYGIENNTGKSLVGTMAAAATTMTVIRYDATFPGVNGNTYYLEGRYEIA